MTPSRKFVAVLLATLACAAAAVYSIHAQSQDQPAPQPVSTLNHNLVLLDPAHGGPDAGATLADNVSEKFNTLALAGRIRTALAAAGFTVILTRDADSSDPLPTDQRAEIANRTHAVACIVLHATNTGSGVHLYTSALAPSDPSDDPFADFVPIPWEAAQAPSVRQSLRLADDLKSALAAGNLPAVIGKAPLRPIDNMMCPAVAIEIAPLAVASSDPTPVTSADYQKRVADSLTKALLTWRTHADPPNTAVATPATKSSAASKSAASKAAASSPHPAQKVAP